MKTKSLIHFTIFILVFASCAPAYVPNVVNTPLLTEKNDLNLAAYTGTAGGDVQASYAIADHIGLMFNGSFADRTSDSTDNYHKHTFFEGGAGYFSKVGNAGIAEIYGGYGFGTVDSYYDSPIFTNNSLANINRIFIQPGIGVSSDFFDGYFATRLAMVNISQNDTSETGFFIEPVLTGKLGYKYVKFVGQVGLSVPIHSSEIEFEYQPFMISLGIQISLGGIFKAAQSEITTQ